ncbi:FkbM family methyltransferase [Roseimicrobium gellanilyticum]|uniref:FkbM family methyltransferase n=1 Tax=Roseimicrobium gellanilyticum TaxID=748857 RepID=UPI001472EE94|nr:FkbM family methyltransferase [Roseimicrobium gellanilyticum]
MHRRPALGLFDYLPGGKPIEIQFDARNTQFHAVYLPKFAEGYEPETSVLLDAFLRESGVFWDIGSNWGYFPLYACARPEFTGEIHAFEPTPSSFRDLASVVKQAGLSERVHCHQLALGDVNGTSCMAVPDGVHSGLASLDANASGERVKVMTADSMDLPDPSVIKLDVEGHEAAVLRGAQKVLNRAKPVIIMENWAADSVSSLEPLRLLESLGYHLYQPAWAFEQNGVRCLMQTSKLPRDHRRLGLALVPMPSEERNLRREYANLLALPASHESATSRGGLLPEEQFVG